MALSAAAAATVIGVGVQYQASQKQADIAQSQAREQRKAAELEKRRADIANTRSLRASIRQARLATGGLVNTAAQTGTAGSSSVQGGIASIGTQLGVNRGAFSQNESISEGQLETSTAIADLSAESGKAQALSAWGGLVRGVGGQAFSDLGGFKTLFGK